MRSAGGAEAERQDFERLASICNFMGLKPFCDRPGLFMKAFYEPYRIRGDTSGISAFLASTMVRHKVPDFVLPPLTRKVVKLDFNPLERLTCNVILSLFASNSVQSGRTDVSAHSDNSRCEIFRLMSYLYADRRITSSIVSGYLAYMQCR